MDPFLLFVLSIIILVAAMVVAVYTKEEWIETVAVVIALAAALYIGGYMVATNPKIGRWMNPTLSPTADVTDVKISPDGKTITFPRPTQLGTKWVVETDQNPGEKRKTLSETTFSSNNGQPFKEVKVHLLYDNGNASPAVEMTVPVTQQVQATVRSTQRVPDITAIKWASDKKSIAFPQLTEVGAKWMVKTDQTPTPEEVTGNEVKSKNGNEIATCDVHILFSDGTTSTTVNVPK